MLTFAELNLRWRQLRHRGLSVREVACIGAPRTLLLAELGTPSAPCIALSAGVHGDEPAGPAALLSLVEDGLLDPRFSYRIWPCTNPAGLIAGTRGNLEGDDINRSFSRGGTTPEARAIIAANRDRRFALSLDLHEDTQASGFYCYESDHDVTLSGAIIRALDDAGLPIQMLAPDFDLGYPPQADHLRRLERGLAIPNLAEERKYFKGLPYSLYIGKVAARHFLTLESPAPRSWELRIATHRIAVVAAIDALLKVSSYAGAKDGSHARTR
ncbi:MAG: succinylglutamate desuccinylase/aspartoacylase family protein [Candidatus Eremiobacteraeota bacterium]|nr:succinylglutamate desuccinylase/aspartoacylase family protein [Candidatus Eremiobacteraeota bacterium]